MSDYYYKCECYKVGGPFIAEDPECPEHGYAAQRQNDIAQQDREALEEELCAWREMFPDFSWDPHLRELIKVDQ